MIVSHAEALLANDFDEWKGRKGLVVNASLAWWT